MEKKVDIQLVQDIRGLTDVEAFQQTIWNSVTAVHHLIASVNAGGHVIGAYDEDRLVGFCYGFPGFKNNENVLISHMMGVDPAYRNKGIGEQMKRYQKEWAMRYSNEKIQWTYDPLEARNGYLNVHKLGGYVQTYYPSYYGEMDNDEINHGLPTDRFLLELDLKDRPCTKVEGPVEAKELVSALVEHSFVVPVKKELAIKESTYKISVPANIHEMKKSNLDIALKWRYALRESFSDLFSKGYRVVDMNKNKDETGVHHYIVKKEGYDA
ncbi:GNAT family N-acetyltransferase [Bacillus shivajii]|uniref:GNAT family N-acetyltransferase n=1 Tax=Bacillus shivajii TaxID=1983719 RepID=UPI001CFC2957|nr:GNAT family N-acetyltransferase [Bacillus shivajii]UCZ52783.1 GNAT family N-acetyltransferase [Bacillus shivajii]